MNWKDRRQIINYVVGNEGNKCEMNANLPSSYNGDGNNIMVRLIENIPQLLLDSKDLLLDDICDVSICVNDKQEDILKMWFMRIKKMNILLKT